MTPVINDDVTSLITSILNSFHHTPSQAYYPECSYSNTVGLWSFKIVVDHKPQGLCFGAIGVDKHRAHGERLPRGA